MKLLFELAVRGLPTLVKELDEILGQNLGTQLLDFDKNNYDELSIEEQKMTWLTKYFQMGMKFTHGQEEEELFRV